VTVSSTDPLRALAFAIAYRMLGSVSEAEDVVQEALLRLHSAGEVENREAFLTTVTTRLAIDVLRSARVRRETYSGSWLPEPLVEDEAVRRVEDEEAISLAFLVLLERLTPDERAVLVLRDSFDYAFAEIADVLGKSEANVRQLLSRARRRVSDERPRFDADPEQRHRLAARFLKAAREGDMEGLVALLAPDAVLVGDGGGKARSIPRPMAGGARVARALAAFYVQGVELGVTLEPALVNGQPGFRARDADGRVVNIVSLDVAGGVVQRVYSMLNPDKLAHVGPVSDLGLRPGVR
jgi:RNA polymerase sigma-70 factor, ECF subfamily